MNKQLLFLLLFSGASGLSAQPFQIGHTTITFTDTSRSNRAIETEIYYPADVAGNNVPVTVAVTDRFPLLSFGHGFVMTWDAYENIWEAVVPEGFIIAFPTTEGSLAPSHADFGTDLAFVLSSLLQISSDSTSPFYQRIDTMNCVMGHSMGGGAAFLAAQQQPQIKTLLTLAPAETNPSAIQSAAGISIPALIIAGENDCVTPPPAHQIPMYDSLQSGCKTYISINGGSHCQMAEQNFLCSFGEATCSPQPEITREVQHETINRFIIPWLKNQLKSDCAAGIVFDSLVAADTTIAYQRNCTLCTSTSVISHDQSDFIESYPAFFSDKIFIRSHFQKTIKITVDLYTAEGRKVNSIAGFHLNANEIHEAEFRNLAAGMHFLVMQVNGLHVVKKIIRY